MTFNAFIDEQAERIDGLSPRPRAAVFWLLGYALNAQLSPPEEWASWFNEARDLGRKYITTGVVGERAGVVWAGAGTPTGDQASQLMNSSVICLSTPVGIALDGSLMVGAWVEHALFPVMQRASLDLFADVAFPSDDEDLDVVFEDRRVQAAAHYCQRIVAELATLLEPDEPTLDRLVQRGKAEVGG